MFQPGQAFSEEKIDVKINPPIYLNGKELDKRQRNPIYDIAVDSEGRLYVPEFYANRVTILGGNGNIQRQIRGIHSPHGVALDPTGNL